MSVQEVRKFVESWIVDAKKDSVAVIDKPIQICGMTLPDEVVGLLKAHYFVECEERAGRFYRCLKVSTKLRRKSQPRGCSRARICAKT